MDHIIMAQLFAGAFILIVFIILALKAFQRRRREKAAAFRYYFFSPEYERDLLEQSALSESEEWRADYRPSFTPFRLRHPELRERR